ncbi:hypothetical protein PEX1_029430 [Penicillium expansum]|uniref:Uncharacterized protein n=1 Tax=Penicillium expansum TaxID=27334 RepID=A0A0A2I1F4_PENEN|nr:hypothetical protein PEX2_050160 [Penicillium expansum]KGO36328.1 hypothetical protein PEX1_029430 [Penicillium expansum]KGO48536.1 hypothetical protein PEXP_072660 [Penicillium expansum]KGO55528.1 hypothetical protein PEX2_050160 [Penicillium expansum]
MDDDYVAQILAKEAKESSIKYASQGMSAFMPSRPTSNAPKPNTRFLRNLIKVTDNHNTALKLKEEREAREQTTKEEIGKIAAVHIGKELEVVPLRRNETGPGGIDEETKSMAELERETKTAMNIGASTGIMGHPGKIDGTEIRSIPGGDVSDHTRGLPADLHTETEVPTAIAIEDKNVNLDILLAPFPVPAHQSRTKLGVSPLPDMAARQSEMGNESDPLEDLVGPLPPRQNEAPVRSRGRGAYKHNMSNIDAHFAPGYDPAADVHLDEDKLHTVGLESSRRPVAGLMTKDDDWDMAMEALRDRERWRNKGEERLRTAGIDEAVIDKWKNNTAFAGVDGEGKPEDVQWSKKGEGREWDRGKFVDDDGHIDIRAAW